MVARQSEENVKMEILVRKLTWNYKSGGTNMGQKCTQYTGVEARCCSLPSSHSQISDASFSGVGWLLLGILSNSRREQVFQATKAIPRSPPFAVCWSFQATGRYQWYKGCSCLVQEDSAGTDHPDCYFYVIFGLSAIFKSAEQKKTDLLRSWLAGIKIRRRREMHYHSSYFKSSN